MKQYFRHKITGKIGQYPERYGVLFRDVFEPVDDPDTCLDCGPQEVAPEEEPEVDLYDYSLEGEEEE